MDHGCGCGPQDIVRMEVPVGVDRSDDLAPSDIGAVGGGGASVSVRTDLEVPFVVEEHRELRVACALPRADVDPVAQQPEAAGQSAADGGGRDAEPAAGVGGDDVVHARHRVRRSAAAERLLTAWGQLLTDQQAERRTGSDPAAPAVTQSRRALRRAVACFAASSRASVTRPVRHLHDSSPATHPLATCTVIRT